MLIKSIYIGIIIFVMFLYSGTLLSQPISVTFNYTGNSENWVVPSCVTMIDVSITGAIGGGFNAGNGASLSGTLIVTPGQTLQINVGGAGSCPTGGYNGGGPSGVAHA